MDFEDILKDVGGFGVYQKVLVAAFLIPTFIVIPWFSMNSIFINNSPDHWCNVPEVVNSNLSIETQKYLVRPVEDKFCTMYDVDYSELLSSGNITVNQTWPTKECDHGWQFDRTNYDATSVTRWNMVCEDGHFSSLVLSLIFIGDVIGTPLYGFLSDKWGRKPTFLFMAFVLAVSEIGSTLSPDFTLFLVLRTLNGACMSTVYSVGYIILLELVNPSMRARMNGVATTSWTVGLCLLPLIAYLTRHWIRLSIVTSCTAASLLLYWKILPESPKNPEIWRNREKTEGRRRKASPLDFFRYPTLRKRFLLVTICWVGNSIPYFGLQMNVKNLTGNEFFNFFLISLIEVPAHFSTWLFMERIGRRWCSVCAFSLSTFACFLPVIFPPEYENVGVIASLLAKAGTSSAFMTLYQQGPELFPTSLRGVGLGMSCTIGTGSTLIVPYIVYLSKYGFFIPFLTFAVISFISAICAMFLPETLNKKLPQTVEDAENFQKNFRFCSCGNKGVDEDTPPKQNTWTPRTLSAIDLSLSFKDISDPMALKKVSDSEERTMNGTTIEIPLSNASL
ncbi:carcinine transporter [Caerostris extrusa]|uniref:Carcinine transporter n=1 Tax=Caerostris extrusa TaxID=172846 RepID=A0AAV4N5P0_CAEEX|nr:carcinine transporter [Caerostris extrusa]